MIIFAFKEKETFLGIETAISLGGLITPPNAKKSRTPIYLPMIEFPYLSCRGIAMRSQLWFPSSLSSPERLTLPARGRVAQEKRDSENRLVCSGRVETISCEFARLCVR